jgi:hypothetical protein
MRIVITCVSALALSLSMALEDPARLEFKTHGFSIEALEETSEVTVQALVMTLPPTDGFAANINVQVQPYTGTLEEYMALSTTQLKQVNFKELKTETKGGRCMMEYTGTTQGRALHFYSVAKKRGNKIVLVTATATQAQWPKVSQKLLRCADSLKIGDAK